MARDGKLRMAITFQGGGGDWRDLGVAPDGAANIASYIEYARIGEEGLFDFGFIADSAYITKDSVDGFLSRLEPMSALSAVSSVTSHIGLVGTFTTSYSYPFTTARQLASLDVISGGRAGWNAVTSALEGVARNHNGDKLMPHEQRYKIANEYIAVVRGLWDSWEDDAFVRDRERGVYADLDKMHTLDHRGEFFQVQGPLNIERSPQGRPVIFQAGGSDAGRDMAARFADCVFSGHNEEDPIAAGKEYSADLARRLQRFGRSREDVRIFPMVSAIIGDTAEEAEAIYRSIIGKVDIGYAVKHLGRFFSFFDFGQFPLDEPLPELGDIGKDSFRSHAEYYLNMAREERLTLRELALRSVTPRGGFVGTPKFIADELERGYDEGAFDGVILATSHEQSRRFVRSVIPELQRRGRFRTEYESRTLRGNLGLNFPVNRHALARATGVAAE